MAEIHDLHIGESREAVEKLVPDDTWPKLYRIHWPDGVVSPPGNLTRAKDAARRSAGLPIRSVSTTGAGSGGPRNAGETDESSPPVAKPWMLRGKRRTTPLRGCVSRPRTNPPKRRRDSQCR